MFRVRKILEITNPHDSEAITQIQGILRTQFSLLSDDEINKLPDQLQNPLKYRFCSILFVAEDSNAQIKGFALLLHFPDLNFCYLDYISTTPSSMGKGIGGALYQRVREEATALNSIGLFLESLPDDPKLCKDIEALKQNMARLKFYERYGARPIINTKYETPVREGDDCPPYLLFDDLGKGSLLKRDEARTIVRAILERKYRGICSPEYIDMVVQSIQDDPVRLREPLYHRKLKHLSIGIAPSYEKRIVLIVNEKHEIHHVKERGYVESPVRVRTIKKEILSTGLFNEIKPEHYSERHIRKIHRFVDYFKRVCEKLPPKKSVYPYVFPIRNAAKPPRELLVRAGYYCIDTFTPINKNAFLAAKRAVDCALTGADRLLEGFRIAYALVRPPGHHAERFAFGGFCYFNSAAIASDYLSNFGKVVVIDIDYHNGNGTQEIFYTRSDVLTISIHGHPNFAYPYFSGFREETGDGHGKGYNINYPLPEKIDGQRYRDTLNKAIWHIKRFRPRFLIISLGLDTAKNDPTGTWTLRASDFYENGRILGHLKIQTLVVQEGGYDNRVLGVNARHFFKGLWEGYYEKH